MKKILLLLSAVVFSSALSAQQTNTSAQETDSGYNKWSIEVIGGVHKPVRPMSSGYYTATPSFGHFGLGARYMFNDRFGLKLDGGYQMLKAHDNSADFESNYFRTSLQGVVNLGNVLRFEDWTKRLGLLVHAGAGYSYLEPKEPIERNKDNMGNFIFGVTPQIKLGERVALTADVSAIAHTRPNYTWEGTQTINTRGFNNLMLNASVGLTFYLGKHDHHADWAPQSVVRMSDLRALERRQNLTLGALEQRLAKVEAAQRDQELPAYLSQSALDGRYLKKNDYVEGSGGMEDLIKNGYVNVYFKFDSDTPEDYSLVATNYLVNYLEKNPSARATLTGYADEQGNADYNQKLSERRAKKVYDILVAAGISESRLSYTGAGVDESSDGSASSRRLSRRVNFSLD